MKTPITREKIKNHLTYASWKYALLVIVAIFGWNLIYSVTQYQPPEEKKVILGIYAFADEIGINGYMEQVRQADMPDMEEMSASIIMPDEMYGDMILSTCQNVLKEEFPALYAQVSVMLPDEKTRRVGQSVAAASLPELR